MSDTNTARDNLLTRLGMAPGSYDRARDEALLDAFRDEVAVGLCYGDARAVLGRHRDQVLTEAAELLVAEVASHRYCADKLLSLRSTGAPERPKHCNALHPVAFWWNCGREPGHEGNHAAGIGEWPDMPWPFPARTTTAQEQQ